MKPWKISLFALSLMAVMQGPAFAADAVSTPPAATQEFINQDKVGELEKMTPDARKAFFKNRFETFKSMTPEQREAYKAKRKAWFEGLPEDQQKSIKERMGKMRAEWKAERKAQWEKMTPEEKTAAKAKMKEKFDALPEEKKAEIKKHHEERKARRMERKNGGDKATPAPDGQ